ncbi:MAG: (2Fe-2S) ferredoxin domain-containing protein [Marinilabiliaceae bacterium]|nr:(2Fe-2S) ferredoxin domain-containing protein [Marinilabiliaceae bacterium]
MAKVKTLADLRKMSEDLKTKIQLREKGDNPESMIQLKVSMATCGIASGAKEVMDFFIEELDKQNIDAVVTQTGCMGYCFAEPTIEITLPGQDPIVYGFVNELKAKEIIEKYVKNGEMVEGIIPTNYQTPDNQ